MKKIQDQFRWTEQAHGDAYILGEGSYNFLFDNGNEDSLRRSDNWLDIGAHIGSFAIPAAQRVRKVVAVEPEPMNARHLRQNVELNWATNVHIVEAAAIAGHDTKVELGLGKTFSYTHKVGRTKGRQHIQVDAVNINALVELYRINKIKMDCEGLELELLNTLFLRNIEEIVLEWHFTLIPDPDWVKLRYILDYLKAAGFEIIRAPKDLENPTKRWTAIIWTKRP